MDNDTAKMLDQNPLAKRAFLKVVVNSILDDLCAKHPGESRAEMEKMLVERMMTLGGANAGQ